MTAIHPRGAAGTGDPVAAGFHAQNGNGEMTGVSWINESGTPALPRDRVAGLLSAAGRLG